MDTGHRAITRRTLLGSATAIAAVGIAGPGTGTAVAAAETSPLWAEFRRTPYT
ncbi:hypothetical protein HRW13_19110, partial [Streptomyces lunaelactis]|nr:hypothetical protein [Streptomyces lunaelactis]NUK59431.1 hypothetical protein [Streptomyces lunaelactis]